jgi:hypothetical protein
MHVGPRYSGLAEIASSAGYGMSFGKLSLHILSELSKSSYRLSVNHMIHRQKDSTIADSTRT